MIACRDLFPLFIIPPQSVSTLCTVWANTHPFWLNPFQTPCQAHAESSVYDFIPNVTCPPTFSITLSVFLGKLLVDSKFLYLPLNTHHNSIAVSAVHICVTLPLAAYLVAF